jgi:N-acetylneuraminic acid mutarotase
VAAGGYSSSEDTGDNEGYNVPSNSWTSLATEPTGTNESCTGSVKGSLYLAGGSNGSGNAVDNTQSFKVAKDKWTTQASMPHAVAAPGSAVYKSVLYCFGGGSASSQFVGTIYDYLQIYQP